MSFPARSNVGGIFSCRKLRAYTLLEMCVVIFIIMLFVTAGLPAIDAAFTEQALRADSRELALMVRTAMVQAHDQQRPYVIDLTESNLYLHPAEPLVTTNDDSPQTGGQDADSANGTNVEMAPEDIEIEHALDHRNKLLVPDPDSPAKWVPVTPVEWRFDPNGLCLLPKVRIERGKAWQQFGFSALTGSVEDETYYFP